MFIFHNDYDTTSSGLSIVILNLIRGLLLKNEKILLIAKIDGALHNNLKDVSNANLIVINSDKDSVRSVIKNICITDTIVTTHFFSIFKLFKKVNPKIIFYSVNIDTLALTNRYRNADEF